MKATNKNLFFVFVLLFCLLTASVFSVLIFPTNDSQVPTSDEDFSSFLQFEQSIIAMSNDNAPIIDSSINTENQYFFDTEEFALKRLIVQGNLEDTYGAYDVASYNDLHVLCYETVEETMSAFDKLSRNSNLSVFADRYEDIDSYFDKEYDYSGYTNWGAEAMDIGGYRQMLADRAVEKEVVVVVIDTGINTSHPMFENRLLTDENGKIRGYSYYDSTYQYSYDNLAFDVDDESTPDIDEGDSLKYSFEDDSGHGAHVAGIICDLTPSNVKILPIKISGSDAKSTSAIILSAYLRVLNVYSKQFNVVCTNLSFSGAGKADTASRDTFNQKCYGPLLEKNILAITSAGNDKKDMTVDGLLAVVVSALRQHGDSVTFETKFSNYGVLVDVSAPGSAVSSAGISSTDSACSTLVSKSGTSMASPQVAGVVAMLYLNPDLPADFTAEDIEQELIKNCKDMGDPGKDAYYGHGAVNLKYFDTTFTNDALTFYKNGTPIAYTSDKLNFDEDFTLEIVCDNPDFEILYTTDGSNPNLSNATKYTGPITFSGNATITAMGVKIENEQIVQQTKLFSISLFDTRSPVEDFFTISADGRLLTYTGNFTHLTIPSVVDGIKVTGISPYLFEGLNLQWVTLPEAITDISGNVFKDCDDLEYFYGPNVKKLYISAFESCDSLTAIYDHHPTSTETVGVFLPNLEETVGFSFAKCYNLQSVSLSKLTTFCTDSGYDFQFCYALTDVYLPSVTSLSFGAFMSCPLSDTFYIGDNVQSIGFMALFGSKIKTFELSKNNKHLYTDGICVYTADTLTAFAYGNENINYTILDAVEIDGVESHITSVDHYIMRGTTISELTIPSTITKIGRTAFYGSKINNLYYNATTCVDEGYFDYVSFTFFQPFLEIDTVEIGENVDAVPDRLFQNTPINKLIVNSSETAFKSSSLRRDAETGTPLNRLTLNFTDTIDSDYLNMFSHEAFLTCGSKSLPESVSTKYLYSKARISSDCIENADGFAHLVYESRDDGYFVYSEEDLAEIYSITATASEYGTISPSGVSAVREGSPITYTFAPNTGCHLSSVIIDGVELSPEEVQKISRNGYTFQIVEADHTIEAIFERNSYSISISSNEYGSISPTSVDVLYGDDKTFTFTANEGCYISYILVDGVALTPEKLQNALAEGYTFESISDNHTIEAIFERNSYSINVFSNEYGVISPATINALYGDDKTFTFTANEGCHIVSIFVDGTLLSPEDMQTAIENGYTFESVADNHSISAIFERNSYSITVSANEGGSISPVNNKVFYGDNETFTFTPKEGHHLSSVFIDGVPLTNEEIENALENGYTFENVTENHSIEAVFEINRFSVVAITIGQGTINHNGESVVSYGEELSYEFTPDNGYYIKNVLVDNVSVGAVPSYTFASIDEDHTILVEYEIKRFNITISSVGQGIINCNGNAENVVFGNNRTFVINAQKGWEIAEVLVNGTRVQLAEGNMLVFSNIDEDIDVQVVFTEISTDNQLTTIVICSILAFVLIIVVIALLIHIHKKDR